MSSITKLRAPTSRAVLKTLLRLDFHVQNELLTWRGWPPKWKMLTLNLEGRPGTIHQTVKKKKDYTRTNAQVITHLDLAWLR
jgi:hypothetical protein